MNNECTENPCELRELVNLNMFLPVLNMNGFVLITDLCF